MGRIVGIDYGKKRIGLAVTDQQQIFAFPLNTVTPGEFDEYLSDYLKNEAVDAFAIGYPVQMNNQPSESVIFINPFIKKLKKKYPEKHIHLVDERFTSQMAHRTLIESGLGKKARQDKKLADKISASIILQSFLESRKVIKDIKS
jgi:putative Holliday junction resolvase